MQTIFAASLLAAVSMAEPMAAHEFSYMKYVAQWNKSYGTREEFVFRMNRWLEADAFIQEVNAPGSEYTHTAGHNLFSDYTEAEYKQMLSAPKHFEGEAPVDETVYTDVPNGSKDWRQSNCLTAVKNQGNCGSCYAFSAVETVESSYCIHHNTLYTMSPQQIVDCSG